MGRLNLRSRMILMARLPNTSLFGLIHSIRELGSPYPRVPGARARPLLLRTSHRPPKLRFCFF